MSNNTLIPMYVHYQRNVALVYFMILVLQNLFVSHNTLMICKPMFIKNTGKKKKIYFLPHLWCLGRPNQDTCMWILLKMIDIGH